MSASKASLQAFINMSELQQQRFELKYIVSEGLALRIRDFVGPYLSLDSFGAMQADQSYPVHSLYLDSPDLVLYQSTVNGDRNRYKLRIRFYEGDPEAPVYFEIKRREDSAIYKQRCAVRRDAVGELVAGRIPDHRDLAVGGEREERAMWDFCRLVNQIRAWPVAHVAYRREAWLSHGCNRLRLTMDRQIRICRENGLRLDRRMRAPVSVYGKRVVLELKFTGRFPNWMRELVEVFEISPCSAAKYVDGTDRLGDSLPQPFSGRDRRATAACDCVP